MNPNSSSQQIRSSIEIAVNLILIVLLVSACLRILWPFVPLIVWAAVIAVVSYKPFTGLQDFLGGNKKMALTVFTLLGLLLVLLPTWLFVGKIVDGSKEITMALESGSIEIRPPSEKIQSWPIVGERVYASWSEAAENFQAWLNDNTEMVRSIVSGALGKLGGMGLGALQFVVSTLIAAAFLANAQSISQGLRRLLHRLVGDRADDYLKLSAATTTSVAVGVLGISLIQSLLAGLGMAAVGVPGTGIIMIVLLIVCIAQLPPWLVMAPVAVYVFSIESTTIASIFAVWAVIVSFLDMVLKPMFLGRGVDAPMLVILLGAIGGMLLWGIVGLFVGAVVLALGYKLFEAWLDMNGEHTVIDSILDGAQSSQADSD